MGFFLKMISLEDKKHIATGHYNSLDTIRFFVIV